MKLLITGVCGFAGSALAHRLAEMKPDLDVYGVDNFIRPGSETNRDALKRRGVKLFHGDVRTQSDFETLPAVDWVIDAAANPSVLAGVDGRTSSRQLVEHNLNGTVNILEFCAKHRAGFTLLSTSRVYSVAPLAGLAVEPDGMRFKPKKGVPLPHGLTEKGVGEAFSVTPPLSLYGSTKSASETLALEYGEMFGFPVWINRCGVLAGAGQFGRADQGIFAFWINACLRRWPLKYIGFGGKGLQVRDALHPSDLAPLLLKQFSGGGGKPRTVNLGGGIENSMSLAELSAFCAQRFGHHEIAADDKPRPFDIPWMVMDCSLAKEAWDWKPSAPLVDILEEIAAHAEKNPDWLERTGA